MGTHHSLRGRAPSSEGYQAAKGGRSPRCRIRCNATRQRGEHVRAGRDASAQVPHARQRYSVTRIRLTRSRLIGSSLVIQ